MNIRKHALKTVRAIHARKVLSRLRTANRLFVSPRPHLNGQPGPEEFIRGRLGLSPEGESESYLGTDLSILSASSGYSGSHNGRARENCLDKQRECSPKDLENHDKHPRILPQEPTALSSARRVSANPLRFEPLGSCRSEAETSRCDIICPQPLRSP